MLIETYQVEEDDGRKVIHYNGFTWARQLYEELFHDTVVEKPYAATEGAFCYVEVGEDNFERACDEFERVKQYQYDMDEDELLSYESDWKLNGNHLHMDDVTQDTPCGMYWFDIDELFETI